MGASVVVTHPESPFVVLVDEWTLWNISLSAFGGGVDLGHIRRFVIGLGDRGRPVPNGTGLIYIDDICLR
jgi:hypothetical protein